MQPFNSVTDHHLLPTRFHCYRKCSNKFFKKRPMFPRFLMVLILKREE